MKNDIKHAFASFRQQFYFFGNVFFPLISCKEVDVKTNATLCHQATAQLTTKSGSGESDCCYLC